jgi:hypothetical protein
LKVHLHHFSKIKSPTEVTKQQESRFFLLFLLDDRRIRIHPSDYWIRIREAQKHVDPVDPDSDSDPEHCNKQSKILGVINKMANVQHLAGLSSCSVLQYTMLQLSISGQVRHCTIENSQAGPSTVWMLIYKYYTNILYSISKITQDNRIPHSQL